MIPSLPLTTARLTIRRFRPEDADDLCEYLSDARVYRFEPGAPVDRERAGRMAADRSVSPDFCAVELRNLQKRATKLGMTLVSTAAVS